MNTSFAALRHEPVGCVVTIVAGDHGAVQVLNVDSKRTRVVRRVGQHSDHFEDVHGSLVFIGAMPAGCSETSAAVIYDLPDGRVKTAGTARVRCLSNGMAEVWVETECDRGSFRLSATCSGAQMAADLTPSSRLKIS